MNMLIFFIINKAQDFQMWGKVENLNRILMTEQRKPRITDATAALVESNENIN